MPNSRTRVISSRAEGCIMTVIMVQCDDCVLGFDSVPEYYKAPALLCIHIYFRMVPNNRTRTRIHLNADFSSDHFCSIPFLVPPRTLAAQYTVIVAPHCVSYARIPHTSGPHAAGSQIASLKADTAAVLPLISLLRYWHCCHARVMRGVACLEGPGGLFQYPPSTPWPCCPCR